MKREFLKGLGIEGLTDEAVQKIMDAHGATVETNKKTHEKELAALQAKIDARPDVTTEAWEAAQSDLASSRESLKAYDGVDVAALQANLATEQQAREDAEAKQAGQMNALAMELLLREKLAGESFSSNYARNGVFSDLKGKIAYEPGENGAVGAITGFDEAIAEIRESNPTAFATADAARQPPKAEAKQHKSGGDPPPRKTVIPTLI